MKPAKAKALPNGGSADDQFFVERWNGVPKKEWQKRAHLWDTNDSADRLIDLPYTGNAREDQAMREIDSETPYKYSKWGDPKNLDVSNDSEIAEADKYDREGYETRGLNIVTGRTKKTKFTGHK